MTFWSVPHATLAETQAWVDGTINAPRATTREFTILLGDQIIGKAGIWKAPELGYFLARDFWGQGFMKEALTALVPHLFNIMDFDVMRADVTPGNLGSERLLEGLGFSLVRRGEKDYWDGQTWCDTHYFELPRP